MTKLDSYQAALDEVYRTFMRVKDRVKGLYDHEIRDPMRLLQIAKQMDIMPAPEHTLRVTGSKGKGTTSRAAAVFLSETLRDRKVGLFISPEEMEHVDRMRVNGRPIEQSEFVRVLNEIMPYMDSAEAALAGNQYLSPFGIFLLIALKWFREQDVDYYVLETGRGVRFDEVGNLSSRTGLVTSILLEHADKLGPSLADIAGDKLSIGRNSLELVVSESVDRINQRFGLLPVDSYTIVKSTASVTDKPMWLENDLLLARSGVASLLECTEAAVAPIDTANVSAAFILSSYGGKPLAFEALINLESLDRRLIEVWQQRYGTFLVVASLPDDKDRGPILEYLASRGAMIVEVVLEGTRGYLNYHKTLADARYSKIVCHYEDAANFGASLKAEIEKHALPFTYVVGTQTFFRLARKAVLR